MRWSFRLGVGVLGMLGALALSVPGAAAHALLRHSVPEDGAELSQAPNAVTATFTEEPEAQFAVIQLLDGAGKPVAETGPMTTVPGQPTTLRLALGRIGTGVYTVTWRVVSRVDGHVTGGTFAFGVGVSPLDAPRAELAPPAQSSLAIPGKFALYAGALGLLGSAWVWAIATPFSPKGARRLLWLFWLIAAIGLVGLAQAQRSDAGADWAKLFGTAIGRALLWRALPLLLAGVGIVLAGGQLGRARRMALMIVGISVAALMLAHVAAGHAGAGADWRWAKIAIQWAHFVGVGVWLGGLAALLVALRGAPDEDKVVAARRFSAVAGVALGVVAVTGVVRAVDEVGALGRLLTASFGQLVLLKGGCLLLLAALGAINRYRNVPAAPRTLGGLRRIGTAELAIAAIVLVITGFLTGFPPASYTQEVAAEISRLAISGNDYATSVRATLEVTPGYAGPNRFVASVRDYDTGTPVLADRLTLRFALASRPDIPASTLLLSRGTDGIYQGRGSNLSIDGSWAVVLVIERGATSTEVPLSATTRARPQHVHALRAPGQPTLYVVDFPDKRSVQIYLDPERPGPTQVHVTYFDAEGKELPITREIAVRVSSGDRPVSHDTHAATGLPVRRFGAGHFIADATVERGPLHLDIEAIGPQGEPLRAMLAIQI